MTASDLDATKRIFLGKFAELVREFSENEQEVMDAQKFIDIKLERQDELRAAVAQLKAAADQLGFDLFEENTRAWAASQAAHPEPPVAAPAMTLTTRAAPTVREFILHEAEKAYPGPVLAADLRRRMADLYGVQVHEKTFGMTLYRLSKEDPPRMLRKGRQEWFLIQPNESEAAEKTAASDLFT